MSEQKITKAFRVYLKKKEKLDFNLSLQDILKEYNGGYVAAGIEGGGYYTRVYEFYDIDGGVVVAKIDKTEEYEIYIVGKFLRNSERGIALSKDLEKFFEKYDCRMYY